MTRRKFADGTDVPVTQTRAELEDMLTRNGAVATAVFNSPDAAAVAFEMHGRRVLIRLPLPSPKDRQFTHVTRREQLADLTGLKHCVCALAF